MIPQYDSPEEELDDLYFSLHSAIPHLEDLNFQRELKNAQKQATIIVRGIDRIQKLLKTHPNGKTLEMQIGEELRSSSLQASKALFSCEGRDYDYEQETPESIAFWESWYEEAHTIML